MKCDLHKDIENHESNILYDIEDIEAEIKEKEREIYQLQCKMERCSQMEGYKYYKYKDNVHSLNRDIESLRKQIENLEYDLLNIQYESEKIKQGNNPRHKHNNSLIRKSKPQIIRKRSRTKYQFI